MPRRAARLEKAGATPKLRKPLTPTSNRLTAAQTEGAPSYPSSAEPASPLRVQLQHALPAQHSVQEPDRRFALGGSVETTARTGSFATSKVSREGPGRSTAGGTTAIAGASKAGATGVSTLASSSDSTSRIRTCRGGTSRSDGNIAESRCSSEESAGLAASAAGISKSIAVRRHILCAVSLAAASSSDSASSAFGAFDPWGKSASSSERALFPNP